MSALAPAFNEVLQQCKRGWNGGVVAPWRAYPVLLQPGERRQPLRAVGGAEEEPRVLQRHVFHRQRTVLGLPQTN